ncbi:MAG TPA: hypothetical protein VFC78_16360 [Tepidisphaeraceae bacterium]|nr:hypothetical protein [Tepidisphaeraceae bacterium]
MRIAMVFALVIGLVAAVMLLLYFAARTRRRSVHWMWWGLHPLFGLIALLVLLSKGDPSAKGAQKSGITQVVGWVVFIFGLGLVAMFLTNLMFFGFQAFDVMSWAAIAFSLLIVMLGYYVKSPDKYGPLGSSDVFRPMKARPKCGVRLRGIKADMVGDIGVCRECKAEFEIVTDGA